MLTVKYQAQLTSHHTNNQEQAVAQQDIQQDTLFSTNLSNSLNLCW